jgi:hypothetical protein
VIQSSDCDTTGLVPCRTVVYNVLQDDGTVRDRTVRDNIVTTIIQSVSGLTRIVASRHLPNLTRISYSAGNRGIRKTARSWRGLSNSSEGWMREASTNMPPNASSIPPSSTVTWRTPASIAIPAGGHSVTRTHRLVHLCHIGYPRLPQGCSIISEAAINNRHKAIRRRLPATSADWPPHPVSARIASFEQATARSQENQ